MFAVLLPLHPAITENIAAGRRSKIHCLIATANLLEVSCVSISATGLAPERGCQFEHEDRLALQVIALYLADRLFADHH